MDPTKAVTQVTGAATQGISDGNLAWVFVVLAGLILFALVAGLYVWRKTEQREPITAKENRPVILAQGSDDIDSITDEIKLLSENQRDMARISGRMEPRIEAIHAIAMETRGLVQQLERQQIEHERTANNRFEDIWQKLREQRG